MVLWLVLLERCGGLWSFWRLSFAPGPAGCCRGSGAGSRCSGGFSFSLCVEASASVASSFAAIGVPMS